jgi:hypothetical protein
MGYGVGALGYGFGALGYGRLSCPCLRRSGLFAGVMAGGMELIAFLAAHPPVHTRTYAGARRDRALAGLSR